MSKSIRISKKHGVNPTIPICFWCGKEKNEIALLGKLPNDIEAPRKIWIPGDYEPCDSCKTYWSKGIRIVEAYEQPFLYEKQSPYYGVYPSENLIVLKDEALEQVFSNIDYNKVRELGMCFIDHEAFKKLISLRDKNTPFSEG